MRTALKVLLTLVVIAAIGGYGAYHYWQTRLQAPITLDEPMLYEVPPGAGFNRVVDDLEAQGVLADAWAFKLLTRVEPDRVPSLKVGEYSLEPGMSGMQVLDKLASAEVVTYSVTIPEGWTFQQMRAALAEAEKLAHASAEMSDDEIMTALGHEGEHPEGRFFPDTYTYHKGVEDLEILRQANQSMEALLEEVWADRAEDLPIDTPYEALIMASLIERETGAPEERRQIAGVFKRRLERGMRLQTDPTVIYGMGDRFEGNITRADLREATPYNTYVIDGLPPTPIALPGRAALEAAVDPEEGDTLYFVAKGDGTHHFSRTLREHNNAVNRYIRRR
ncbi:MULTISPECIES: endolytic transglycosylase MltG [unclassified Halomonas]|uniref:Endolytic murein transglycosylase n=1 Tax=Halomonas sp. H10-59 TaxID=2950874 RepID=A0AAU7KYD7_9GAMM|nr:MULTISPECIES: endolytic transglycosylase MltG [unclassified Halomonas]MBR9878819.1 endolytic transglycosylase MltG [Gammaproteobacteria bacterium]MBS8268906.1 endolytic transglycosylase MltG [Halomonas litopenaei]MBY5942001.1 endolytic transglycosylase MltG [Halomonas sp. DP5N14-9]MBY6112220.1 endolytic transglycosylase MltG [Halomonas sp. DP1Y21-3]MCJ8286761.1 endolytic transglycosylase MltG [Halomonas sp.]